MSSLRSVDSKAQGTENLAINNTFVRRILTIVALKTLGRFHNSDGPCTPISKHIIIKTGHRVRLTEASTMKFVAEHTSLPVPKVYCYFVHKDRAYIVMERIRGEEIPTAWKGLPEVARRKIYSELKAMLQELRALKPSSDTGVESCVGGSLYDSRITRCPRFGPFKTIQDFHFWLRDELRPSEAQNNRKDDDWLDIEKMAEMQNAPWPPPVFTHADLNPFNILVRGDKVVGIIDWEFSGWYPFYWEYTSAWLGNITRTGWQDVLDQFLEPCPAELAMETTRHRWWGEI
ncbi:uncharacterized protein RCC_11162 [Ramularia collo-cygni]|uniref:Aminoglycoside phosphotransferase domain-containing protein n=1 Tax=Ramularia collo-cygni TaxID=112498 RepID=A0A2D3VE72_9PEZI|nr:uncharacterized protein RCC_11162 [Ramularia collo-cygni]CZT25430.1 uncharacterized protein RCC_11162 [Ramularia collo-cygni]